MNYARITRDGLWDNNVVFAQMLALCPLLAVTGSATNGLGMGLASTAVLVCSNVLISSLRRFISAEVRIPVYIVFIATLVTLVDMSLNAWAHDLYKVLGLFIALIVVNCAILGRAEAFASKNAVAAIPRRLTNSCAAIKIASTTSCIASWATGKMRLTLRRRHLFGRTAASPNSEGAPKCTRGCTALPQTLPGTA